MKASILCERCGKPLGEIDAPTITATMQKGYLCGDTTDEGSCAKEWYDRQTNEQKNSFVEEVAKALEVINTLRSNKK